MAYTCNYAVPFTKHLKSLGHQNKHCEVYGQITQNNNTSKLLVIIIGAYLDVTTVPQRGQPL